MYLSIKTIGFGVFFMSANLWSADIDIYNRDSVLAAASLSLSAHNQAVNENQVYIGMFRPDRDAPFWEGFCKVAFFSCLFKLPLYATVFFKLPLVRVTYAFIVVICFKLSMCASAARAHLECWGVLISDMNICRIVHSYR